MFGIPARRVRRRQERGATSCGAGRGGRVARSCATGVCLAAGCLILLWPSTLPAQAEAVPEFSVVARTTTNLRIPEKVVARVHPGSVLSVSKSERGYHWARTESGKSGWILQEAVVPLAEAAPIFTRMIRNAPNDPRNYVSRALVWWVRGETVKVLEDYDRAISLGLREPSVFASRAINLHAVNRLEEAIADYNRSLELEPQAPEVLVNRGVAYYAKQEYEKAVADYDRALEMGADDFHVYSSRAAAHLALGQTIRAIDDYSAAIEKDPNNAMARHSRGLAWRRIEKLDRALADFDQAIRLEPQSAQFYASRGYTYFLQEKHADAIADFSQAIELNPQFPLALNNRGFNHQLRGEFQAALRDYDRALQLQPEFSLALQNKAWLLATCPEGKVRDGEQAVKTARAACESRDWKHRLDLKALAAAKAEVGDFAAAVKWQTKVVSLAPEDARAAEQELLQRYRAEQPYRFSLAEAPPQK